MVSYFLVDFEQHPNRIPEIEFLCVILVEPGSYPDKVFTGVHIFKEIG